MTLAASPFPAARRRAVPVPGGEIARVRPHTPGDRYRTSGGRAVQRRAGIMNRQRKYLSKTIASTLKAAAALGMDPADCLALEDSHNGVRSASSAGMMTVMVPDMLDPTEEMHSLCVRIARDLHEVRTMLAAQKGEVSSHCYRGSSNSPRPSQPDHARDAELRCDALLWPDRAGIAGLTPARPALEVLEERAVGRKHHRRLAVGEALLIGLHRAEERGEGRIATITLGEDPRALGVALTSDLAGLLTRRRKCNGHFLVGAGDDLPLLLFAHGANPRGFLLARCGHAAEDGFTVLGRKVRAADPQVDHFDAQARHLGAPGDIQFGLLHQLCAAARSSPRTASSC
eukprot:gene37020-49948_t